MNCKLRVESAVEKYKEFLGVLELYGLGTPHDLLTQSFDVIDAFFPRFSICGDNRDKEGRSVMWINGALTREEVRKTISFFPPKTIILPRQTRDKHRDSTKKRPFSRRTRRVSSARAA